MKPDRNSGVRCSTWLDGWLSRLSRKFTKISFECMWSIKKFFGLRYLECLIFLNNLRMIRCEIFFFCDVRLNMIAQRMKLIAKHGRNWRLCVTDYEVVQFLQCESYVHKFDNICLPSNEKMSDGDPKPRNKPLQNNDTHSKRGIYCQHP